MPNASLSVVILGQALVQVHQLREMGDILLGEDVSLRTHSSFCPHMIAVAQDINIASLNTGLLSSLWHYVFVARLAPLTLGGSDSRVSSRASGMDKQPRCVVSHAALRASTGARRRPEGYAVHSAKVSVASRPRLC